MTDALRQPPRFVPTLTEVVHPALPEVASGESFVQTDVLEPDAVREGQPLENQQPEHSRDAGQSLRSSEAAPAPVVNWDALAQEVQLRVMASVESVLEERLRTLLKDVVQLHTTMLYQSLSDEMLKVAKTAVEEAVAQELMQACQRFKQAS